MKVYFFLIKSKAIKHFKINLNFRVFNDLKLILPQEFYDNIYI